jgi:hypothetical protein
VNSDPVYFVLMKNFIPSNNLAVMHLQNTSLLQNKAFINGEWIAADSGGTFLVLNPMITSKVGPALAVGYAGVG